MLHVCTAALDATLARGGRVPAEQLGRPFISPTFAGSPAYYKRGQRDSLALLARCGRPSYFVTMTANPGWPEIQENLEPGQRWEHRPDLVSRVFNMKSKQLIQDRRNGNVFTNGEPGSSPASMILWVVEYQKRGLPHVHIAVRVAGPQPVTSELIDANITANMPNALEDPWLAQFVMCTMTHKCTASCAEKRRGGHSRDCNKRFPKPVRLQTTLDDKGFPLYRRDADSTRVVPYNATLLRRYHCHINVEVAASVEIVSYLFKYVFKGADTVNVSLINRDVAAAAAGAQAPAGALAAGAEANVAAAAGAAAGAAAAATAPAAGAPPAGAAPAAGAAPVAGAPEPAARKEHPHTQFMKARYTSAVEATAYFNNTDRSHKEPAVTQLAVHLPNQDSVIVAANDGDVAKKVEVTSSDLIRYMRRPLSRSWCTNEPYSHLYFDDLREHLRPNYDPVNEAGKYARDCKALQQVLPDEAQVCYRCKHLGEQAAMIESGCRSLHCTGENPSSVLCAGTSSARQRLRQHDLHHLHGILSARSSQERRLVELRRASGPVR